MKAAIITAAGISSRFNEGIPEEEQKHKCIYYEKNMKDTLLARLLEKCFYADKIIVVGGSRYEDMQAYCQALPGMIKNKLILTYNSHYADLASGYSLYVGLKELFERYDDVEEVLFSEGDLDVDRMSFEKIVKSEKDVLTYSHEPIYADKAVVLYRDGKGNFRYAFNSEHKLLFIEQPFSCILNSGQIWKFRSADLLQRAAEKFYRENKTETNLKIIQDYIELRGSENFDVIGLKRWVNCNTRQDYRKILEFRDE